MPDGDEAEADATVIYESVRTLDRDGNIKDAGQVGTLDREVAARVSRPWSYFTEKHVYNEQAWQRTLEDGSTEFGYRVIRTAGGLATPSDKPESGAPRLEAGVVAALASGEDGPFHVTMNLRGFPDWDVPPPLPIELSASDAAAEAEKREAALAARSQMFSTLAAPVLAAIQQPAGKVHAVGDLSGWIVADVDGALLAALAARKDLVSIDIAEEDMQYQWPQGQGRADDRIGADKFISNGITGDEPNSGRHSFGRVTVAVSDSRLEDEACFLLDGANCTGTSRLKKRWNCTGTGSSCSSLTDFADVDGDSTHGTMVASVVMADYTDLQGEGFALGDATTSHSSNWRNSGTGMAPEADLVFMDLGPGGSAQCSNAFKAAVTDHVDVFNGSWGYTPTCNALSTQPMEQELENAFDDGVFVVMSAGNNFNPSCADHTACSVMSPADTLKAFAVNAFDASAAACESSYNSCLTEHCSYSLGGMTITTDGGAVVPNAVSQIAVMAPDGTSYSTQNTGANGTVVGGGFYGTSAAAPHMAGLAALLKDQYLDAGNTWVNSPGWLYTIMLGNADRYFEPSWGTTAVKTSGYDKKYGSGKVRLRLLGTGGGLGTIGTGFYTLSFGSGSSPWSTTLWPGPLPAGTDVAKCVLYQIEDMSGAKTEISDIDMKLELYNPFFGQCAPLGGLVSTRFDSSLDNKSMIAYDSSDTTLANKCAKLTVTPYYVAPAGVTTRTFCYFATTRDDEAPQ